MFIQEQLTTPIADSCDVLVCGGGDTMLRKVTVT